MKSETDLYALKSELTSVSAQRNSLPDADGAGKQRVYQSQISLLRTQLSATLQQAKLPGPVKLHRMS